MFGSTPGPRVHITNIDTDRESKLQEGLYKVEFHTVHGTGNGVLYATSGKLRGGNSGFAFIGNYTRKGEEIHVKARRSVTIPTPASSRCSEPT